MKKTLYILIAVLVVLSLFNLGCVVYSCAGGDEPDTVSVRTDTVYQTITDTLHDTVPRLITEYITDSVRIPVPRSDTVTVHDSVSLAVVQRQYTDDSTYTAYVSGLQYDPWPRLDSINVQRRTIVETINNTITIQRPRSKWAIGLQAGYGYGFRSQCFEPYVGVGVTYNFLK